MMDNMTAAPALSLLSSYIDLIRQHNIAPYEYAFLLPETTALEYGLRVFAYGVLTVLGILSNTVSIAVIVAGGLYKNWTYSIVINLCVTDLVYCCTHLAFYLPGIIINRFPFPLLICSIRHGLNFVPMFVSVFSFFLAALHRYLSIVYQKGGLWLFSNKYLPLILPLMWLAAIACSVPLTYPGDYFSMVWIDYCIIVSDSVLLNMKIIPTLLMMCPLIVVFCLYVHMYYYVRKASSKVHGNTAAAGSGGGASKPVSRRQKQMARTLFILYLTAACVYIPYALFFYIDQAVGAYAKNLLFSFGFIVMSLISCCNPVLYALLFKDIKKQYQKLLCKQSTNDNGETMVISVVSTA